MPLAVIYALPKSYATSIRLENITKNMNTKEITQRTWPSFLPLRILMVAKQALVSMIKIRKGDVVYASAPLIASSLPAVLVKTLKRNKLVVDWDDAFTDFSVKKPSRFSVNYWEYKALQMADKVVVVSKTLESIAVKMKGRENVLYLPNGVDTQRFVSKNKKHVGVIVGVSGYIGKMGNRFAYQEMAEAAEQISDARFLVVGHGKGLRDFRAYVKKKGMEERFSFAGFVPHDRMPGIMDKMDICLVPMGDFFTSRARSSVKLKEFMSMGKAIVATRVGENITDLDGGKCGLLAESQDDFVKKIKLLIKDAKLRETLGKRARERAIKLYDYRILREKLKKFILE